MTRDETIKETITAHDRMLKRLWCIAYEEGQKDEREACAKLAERFEPDEKCIYVEYASAAIRARGQSRGIDE